MKKLVIVLGALLFLSPYGYAVVVASGSPNANNTQPTGDHGWSSMAIYNGASAVYLGSGWFITAGHLGTGGGTVNYQSQTYSISKWTSITNANGTSADIRVFQVASPGAISGGGSQVNMDTLSIGNALTMIGYGRDVSGISTIPYNDHGSQTQVRYYEGTVSQMKWGMNEISSFTNEYQGAGFFSDAFETTLYDGQAQALDKDSGGGVFIYDEGSEQYLLAGIMIGAKRYSDENGIFAVTDTGDPSINSKTYSVDLSVYSDQISQAIPEPTTAIMLAGIGVIFGVIKRLRYMYQ